MADEILDLTSAPGRTDRDLGGQRWAGIAPCTGSRLAGTALILVGVVVGLFGAVGAYGDWVRRAKRPLGWMIVFAGRGSVASGVLLTRRRDYVEIAAFERGMVYNDGSATRTVWWADVSAVTEVRVDQFVVYEELDKV